MFWTRSVTLLALLAILTTPALVLTSDDYRDGSDLALFVTRPELRPPLWNVTVYSPEKIVPGYWFVSPYASWTTPPHRPEYQSCQAGPTIFDGAGNLVWSGACIHDNRNVFDFKANFYNDSTYLSYIAAGEPGLPTENRGHGVILNSSFDAVAMVADPRQRWEVNLHELNIVDQGKSALIVVIERQTRNIAELTGVDGAKGNLQHDVFREIDLATGKVLFEWYPLDHGLSLAEIAIEKPADLGPSGGYWDFLHINSVDKNEDGDYLVSARYSNTIYKVSGKDGSIIWRLGGVKNDFVMEPSFNFSSQHHARFISQNETVTILSFLDNASDDHNRQKITSDYSAAKFVALYTTQQPMKAQVIRQIDKPARDHSRKRGNVELLPNNNVWVCWSHRSSLSEHSPTGEVLFEAEFKSARYSTYRAYKFNFTGTPTEPPTHKTFSLKSGASSDETISLNYVSWNGATEVRRWQFWGGPHQDGPFTLLGSADKVGFETRLVVNDDSSFTYAEAIGADGSSLGKSLVQQSVSLDEFSGDDFENSILSMPALQLPQQTDSANDMTLTKRELALGAFGILMIVLFLQASIAFAYLCWTKWLKVSHRYESVPGADVPLKAEYDAEFAA